MRFLIAVLALSGSVPALAQGNDDGDTPKHGGVRVEAHVGIERPNISVTSGGETLVAKLGYAFDVGAELGYDIPISTEVTVGPYVSFDSSRSGVCESELVGVNVVNELCFKAKSNFSAGLRGAMAVGDKGEFYLGIGFDKYNYTFSDIDRNARTNAILFADVNNTSDSGIGISLGYNHHISKTLYVGAGIKISQFGSFEGSSAKLQRVQGHVNLGGRF